MIAHTGLEIMELKNWIFHSDDFAGPFWAESCSKCRYAGETKFSEY